MLIIVLAVVASTGCVRRRLTVRSNPPGAVVYVDNQRMGTTPCSVEYVYYGTREIRLAMQGYETLTVNQPLPAPWYEVPGLDFISENLVPTTINDARTVSFNLRRELLVPAEQVIARGEELRRQATPAGLAPVVPAGALLPPVAAPTPQAQAVPSPVFTAPGGTTPLSLPPSVPFTATPTPAGVPPAVINPSRRPAPGLQDTFGY